jgi:hypothetical protein
MPSHLTFKPNAIGRPGLKTISKAVIAAEILDILITFAGLILFPQMWEANFLLAIFGGWMPLVLFKALATAAVVIVLEMVDKWPRLVIVVPLTAAVPVFWNLLCILAEFLA